jgi:hypothetical protein
MAFVTNGKSITTRRGIKGPGEEVMEKDFASAEVFADLLKRGFLTDKKPIDEKRVLVQSPMKPETSEVEKVEKVEKPAEPEADPNVLPDNAEPQKKPQKKSKK